MHTPGRGELNGAEGFREHSRITAAGFFILPSQALASRLLLLKAPLDQGDLFGSGGNPAPLRKLIPCSPAGGPESGTVGTGLVCLL